jgi:hypothetical protein
MPIRSDVRSTDYHRQPGGENIVGGIDVSVVVCPTFRAIPLSDIKRQFINNVTAVPTAFRTRKPTVNFYQCSTVPLALVLQLTNQLTPTSVGDVLSQLVVLHHILHRQVLDSKRLVFTYQSSRQLVKEICSSVGNSCVNPSHLKSCFLSVVGAFNLAGQGFLSLPQLISKAFEVLRINNFFPVASGNERSDSRINPYRLIYLWSLSLPKCGRGLTVWSSTKRETNQRPDASNLTVTVDGWQLFGMVRLTRIGKGSAHLARNSCPEFHLNAERVNSALPPSLFFLKLGYLVRPAQKLANDFCKCLNPCCKGTELTSDRNCKSSCFFHSAFPPITKSEGLHAEIR